MENCDVCNKLFESEYEVICNPCRKGIIPEEENVKQLYDDNELLMELEKSESGVISRREVRLLLGKTIQELTQDEMSIIIEVQKFKNFEEKFIFILGYMSALYKVGQKKKVV